LVMRNVCRQIGLAAARLASNSRLTARGYIELLAAASRLIDHPYITQRIANSIRHNAWPPLSLRARRVTVGGVSIFVHPHLGEFDQEALFARSMSYELGTFDWLKGHADHYDTVIEIGANVGIFTTYLDKLSARPGSKLKNIYAFEPSPEA
jgi:hypothetical protein